MTKNCTCAVVAVLADRGIAGIGPVVCLGRQCLSGALRLVGRASLLHLRLLQATRPDARVRQRRTDRRVTPGFAVEDG